MGKRENVQFSRIFIQLEFVQLSGEDERRGGRCSPPQIFTKGDLLPVDNYSEKEKIARKIQTTSNSSKTTGDITFIHM